MVKVLAAELSDPARLARGKRYWSDRAVVDIECRPGVVTATVQGSRRQPYEVTVVVGGGTGLPTRRDLRIVCTCPDDTGATTPACKHAVATLLAWSDEVAIEPALIDLVRSSSVHVFEPDGAGRVDAAPVEPDPAGVDEIAMLLVSPAPGGVPELPLPSPLDHPRISDPFAEMAFRSVLDDLDIRWS